MIDTTDTARSLRIDEASALYDGLIELVRGDLGITAFGIGVLDLPPSYVSSAHDESATGREEL